MKEALGLRSLLRIGARSLEIAALYHFTPLAASGAVAAGLLDAIGKWPQKNRRSSV